MSRKFVPTEAQLRVLRECAAEPDGFIFQRAHALGTLRAMQERQWITLHVRRYSSDDNAVKITDAGRACLSRNEARKP